MGVERGQGAERVEYAAELGARKCCVTVAAIDIDLPRYIHFCVRNLLQDALSWDFGIILRQFPWLRGARLRLISC